MTKKYALAITAAAVALTMSAAPSLAQQRKATISQRCKDGTVVTVSTGAGGICGTISSGDKSCNDGNNTASGSCVGGTAVCGTSTGSGSCTITKALGNGNHGGGTTTGTTHNGIANTTNAGALNTRTTSTSTTSGGLTTNNASTLTEQHVNTLGTTQTHPQR